MDQQLERLKLENAALWKLVETLFGVLASHAPHEIQNFINELEKLKK